MTASRISMKSVVQVSYQDSFTVDLMRDKNARYKSEVWNHFGKLKNAEGEIVTPNRFYCAVCLSNKKMKFYSSSIGTGNLSCHLLQVHGIITKSLKVERKATYESNYQDALRKYYDNITTPKSSPAVEESLEEEHLQDTEYMEYNEEDVELENEEYEIALNDNAQEPEPELFVDVKQNLHEVVSETSDNASKRNYDEMFCLSLVPDFSRLKERQKIKVKIEFMRILEDAFYNQDN